jgi:hypothetical protein
MAVGLVGYVHLQGAVVVLPNTNRTNWYYIMALPKIGNT